MVACNTNIQVQEFKNYNIRIEVLQDFYSVQVIRTNCEVFNKTYHNIETMHKPENLNKASYQARSNQNITKPAH